MGLSKAWVPVSGVLLLFGLVPGMPNTLFLAGAVISATIAYFTSKNIDEIHNEIPEDEKEENHGKIDVDEVSDNSVSLDLGYGLISMVDSNDKKVSWPANLKDYWNKKTSFKRSRVCNSKCKSKRRFIIRCKCLSNQGWSYNCCRR